ncbi:MAG TPA: hypothetical protein VF088_20135 [Pyrinomonadaceae bacterium]
MRQRIVINVDGPQGEATQPARFSSRKRRRWLRVLAILMLFVLIVGVVAAAGGFFWWRYYQTTPAYTVTLLVDAAQRNDLAEFQKYVNDDEIAKNMIASVSQKAAARYGYAINSSIQQQIDSRMPALLPRLKQTIHDEVVKEIQVFASKSEPRPFIFLVVTVPRLMTIATEGDTAKVKAPLSDRAIEMTMQRNDAQWKVTEFKDDVVVQHVVDGVMKDLPAIGTVDPNSPLLKQATKKHKIHK